MWDLRRRAKFRYRGVLSSQGCVPTAARTSDTAAARPKGPNARKDRFHGHSSDARDAQRHRSGAGDSEQRISKTDHYLQPGARGSKVGFRRPSSGITRERPSIGMSPILMLAVRLISKKIEVDPALLVRII
jgi:hypothetical protein